MSINNETDFKNVFCDSVEKQGGYTFKIAGSIMSGLPDLYCAMPGYIPVLLEAKWFKDIPEYKNFKRKIPYRPLQREILNKCNSPYKHNCVAYALIGLHIGDHDFCMLLNPQLEIITHKELKNSLTLIKDNKEINIDALFIGRVEYMPTSYIQP